MTALLLRADRLIDGTGAPPVAAASLLLRDGLVAAVFAGPPPDGAVPPGTAVIDLPGCTILPGLIDAHVHLNLPGDGATLEEAVRETDGVLTATATLNAGRALRAGITTVRDLGAARNTVFDVRRALTLGHGPAARIVACGQPITITGGHCWYLGGEADGPERLRVKVREMCKGGADYIKVMATGGGTLGTMSWRPSFNREELAALVDEAHRQDRTITAHCLCAEAIEWVVDAGFDGIEHAGFLVERSGRQEFVPRVADKVAKAGIPCTTTLAVGGSTLRVLRALERPDPQQRALLDRWERMSEANLRQFGLMRDAGVSWVAGTDAGWRHTAIEAMPMELALMAEGGMTAGEAIHAGTGLAARVSGLDGVTGTLRPGLRADVLVVQGNPLDDLWALEKVRLVLQDGAVRVQNAA